MTIPTFQTPKDILFSMLQRRQAVRLSSINGLKEDYETFAEQQPLWPQSRNWLTDIRYTTKHLHKDG